MTKILTKFLLAAILVYLVIYAVIRTTQAEDWEADGNSYVIFPKDQIWVYYAFRPLSYLDSTLTGMRFHIGPHQ